MLHLDLMQHQHLQFQSKNRDQSQTASASLEGSIVRVTFHNEETGFTVAKLKSSTGEQVMIVGQFVALAQGEYLSCEGAWHTHKSFGKQFKVTSHSQKLPEDAASIEAYLASNYVKGIGPVYAKRIVKKFGDQTLFILDHQSEKLRMVEGVGQKRLNQIRESWQEHKAFRDLLFVMQSVGLTSSFAQRIYKTYTHHAADIITKKPYQLCKDIRGIGFLKADAIAKNQGILETDSMRLQAGLIFSLDSHIAQGHTIMQKPMLIESATQLLNVSRHFVEAALTVLLEEKELIQSTHDVYAQSISTPTLFNQENTLASEAKRLIEAQLLTKVDINASYLSGLSDAQQLALNQLVKHPFVLLTGGPGTGKSTITARLIRFLEALDTNLAVVAPTGKAAKRLQELTRFPAKTIHSLLQLDPRTGYFKFGAKNQLDTEWLIVDEVSMLDVALGSALFQAIKTGCRVILVGDPDQLPSVGPGHVLRDLLLCRDVVHVFLEEIFRQAAGSQIIQTAHAIKEGAMPNLENQPDADLFFMEQEEPDSILATIVGLVKDRLPKAYGLNPLSDIQVLTPQHRGPIGTQMLNKQLQHALKGVPLSEGDERPNFVVGDKVIQLSNNYDKEVFNGDIGVIDAINTDDKTLEVLIDGRVVSYENSEKDELALAYAITIHKYQGSEAPCIIMPVSSSHFQMLSRNLYYTGVTRGKRLVVLVGQKKALWIATQKATATDRQTRLQGLF